MDRKLLGRVLGDPQVRAIVSPWDLESRFDDPKCNHGW